MSISRYWKRKFSDYVQPLLQWNLYSGTIQQIRRLKPAQQGVFLGSVFLGSVFLVIGLLIYPAGAYTQTLSAQELQELRLLLQQQQKLIERQQAQFEQQQKRADQQQQEIESLKREVSALRQANASTRRVATDTQQAVEVVQKDVSQAQDDAVQARELAETPRTVVIERSPLSLEDWTRETLGGQPVTPPEQEVKGAEVTTTPENFSVSVGGHINRAVNFANDGDKTKAYFVDSGNVPTLMYVKAYAPVTDDLTLGGHIEYAIQDNAATRVSQDNENVGLSTTGRYFEITADSKRYGKLSFGKGFASAFFIPDVDKTGTIGGNLLSVGGMAGGLKFVDKDTGSLSDTTVSIPFVDIEGVNLLNRVRYDSPVWNGFQISGDIGENQFSDVALRWRPVSQDFDAIVVGSAQKNPQGGRVDWRIDGGFGVLHKPSGLSLTVGGARQSFKTRDEKSNGFIVRGGLRRDWFNIGETKTAIDFTRVWDIDEDGDRGTSAGAFVVQELKDWNAEVYAGYRWYEYNPESRDLDDLHFWTLGARFWFDATASIPRSSE